MFGGKTEQVVESKERGAVPEKLASFHQKMISEREQRARTAAAKRLTRFHVRAGPRVHSLVALNFL